MAHASYVTGDSLGDLSSKSVVIKNVSPDTKEQDIIIHFQRKRNGGGEVDCVRMLGEGTALITFEKSEIAQSVMNRRQEIGGCLLKLEPFRQTVPYQVFGKVSGRLDPNALGIDFSALKTILQTIQDETEIEWKEIFDGFVVSGTFEQMKGMDDVLKNKFKERKGMKKVIPPTHFGESPTISHSRSLPQSNPTESEKCPNVLPEHDQLEVNQSKKEKSSSCTSQDDISATETGVAHGSYLNNNNSIGLHKRPSSTSENSQVGCIEGYKRADRDHSKEEIAFNTNIADKTMSKTRPKLAEHPLHLRQAKISANGNKSSDKNIQDHGETKQHCEDKSLVQCPEINKNESCNVIPQNHHPVPKKDESLGGDLQSNPTESEKCPNVLPEHDQLEVNQSKKEKSSSCTSQDDISATETEVAHGSYLNNNNSIGLHKRPSSTSENSQVGCIEGYKRADRDHSKEEIAFNTNIADKTMSKTRPKLAEHPLHLRQAKISANGNKSSDKNIQDHGETKQHCEDKSLVQCPEINKNESCNVIPQNHHPVPKKDESLGGDLQSTPKLFEKMKSDENSSNMPPPLNKASSEGHSVSEGEATANCHHSHLMQNPEMNKKESCDVIPQYHHPVPKKDESLGGDLQSTPKLFEKMKSDHNSSNMSPALDKASSEGHIETVETNECVSEAEATANGKRRHENSILAESHWKFVTSTGVTVTLLVGDITSQHVDVFLCPANATLSYDEGLSKLIMDKGGQAIKDECLSRVTQSNGHLEDGDTFITCVGNLPCKAVLHAVLPSWNDEMNDEKTTKRQIHKCLLEGLQLASGYRLKSIALPPLGQHFNGVPVEVSAEVIVRVVAAFGKNIGPMHTGIADFYIVCEDGPTIDAFVEEFSSFSFKGQTPFFLSVFLTNHSGKKAESQRTMACQNKDKIDIKETVSVKQTQKEDTKVQSGPLVSSAPALQQEKTPKQETGNEENQNSNPITSVNLGKKLQGNQKEENEKDTTARCERQVCEKKLSFFTSSLIQRTEVSMVRPFEILEVKNAEEKLSEENIKYVVVQDKLPPGKNTTTTLLQDKNLHMNEGEEVTGTCKSVEDTVADITKDIAHNVQWQKIKDMSGQKGDNEDSQDTTIHDLKGIPREQIDGNVSLSDQHTLKSPSSGTNSGIFVTSPTVDDLLNADLGLGIQGLEIFYGEEAGDHSHRSANLKATNEEGKGSKNVLEESPSSSAFPNTSQAFKGQMPFDKTSSKSRSISDKTEKEKFHESVRKDDVDETKKKDDGLAPGKNYNTEDKGNVSKCQLPIPCALCQDSVDHPDLTHPNVCKKHKFCDDCILKAFTISSNCPACMDTTGLIINEKENVNDKNNFQPPSSTPSFPPNQDDNTHRTAIPDPINADQPPGQMTWKKYEASLPGFAGFGTIEIKFVFYEGIQSSEHPHPGKAYMGRSCAAYIPETQEGKEVFKLLRKAFDARLVFTVSTSTSGTERVTLSGIELKTSTECDARNGYPDPSYLSRVRQQLAVKGIR